MTRLAMFPLGTPLLPGSLIALRVFEPRYVSLVQTCLQMERPTFGIAMIERGREVGGGDTRSLVGTRTSIIRVDVLPGGHLGVMVHGDSRIRIEEWLPDDPHPWARIVDWPETSHPEAEIEPHHARSLADLRSRIVDLRKQWEGDPGLPWFADDTVLPSRQSVVRLIYSFFADLPLGPADRQKLLSCDGLPSLLRTGADIALHLEEIASFARLDEE